MSLSLSLSSLSLSLSSLSLSLSSSQLPLPLSFQSLRSSQASGRGPGGISFFTVHVVVAAMDVYEETKQKHPSFLPSFLPCLLRSIRQ